MCWERQMRVLQNFAKKLGKKRKQMKKFKVGDKVQSPALGIGVVTEFDASDPTYPIVVKWTEDSPYTGALSYFTLQGRYYSGAELDKDITLLEGEGTVEEDKTKTDDTRMRLAKEPLLIDELGKYRVGDKVYAPFKYGTITAIYGDGRTYPIEVTWELSTHNTQKTSAYTADGYIFGCDYKGAPTLTVIERASPKEDKTMKDNTTEYTTINPAHYRVKGIPEAIDIMAHLMTKEQLEGFLWGNILKYAYRYGRKGDKKETAGKIGWYAKELEEVVNDN